MDNEELLGQGECPRQYCIEVAGHAGPCTGDFLPYANLRDQLQQAQTRFEEMKRDRDNERALRLATLENLKQAQEERDAAIGRGIELWGYLDYAQDEYKTAIERAEAAEALLQKHHYGWSRGNRHKLDHCDVCGFATSTEAQEEGGGG